MAGACGGLAACGGTPGQQLRSRPAHSLPAHSLPARSTPAVSARVFIDRLSMKAARDPRVAYEPGAGGLRFDDLQMHADFVDFATPGAYTALATVRRQVTVTTSSAARIDQTLVGSVRFATRRDYSRWMAAGAPVLERRGTQTLILPSGQYTFIPQGLPLTYEEARRLSGSPSIVESTIQTHLSAGGRTPVSWPQLVRAEAYLLGTAPLARRARAAVFSALTAVPGLRLCGRGADALGRVGQGVCITGADQEVEVLFAPATGSVLAVLVRALGPASPLPASAGSFVQADTFSRPAA